MIRWTVMAVVAVLGCDKGSKQEPAGPANPFSCKTKADCNLGGGDPCDPCAECTAQHKDAPDQTCKGQMLQNTCALEPCAFYVADCVKGVCVKATKPTQ